MKRSLLALALTIGLCVPAMAQEGQPPSDNGGQPGMHHHMDGDKGGWGHGDRKGHEGHGGHEGWGRHGGHEGRGGHGHHHHGWGGHEGGGMHGHHMTEQETMTFLRANDPQKATELEAAKAKDPEHFRWMLMGTDRMIEHLQMIQKHDPTGFQVELAEMKAQDRVHQLMHSYHEAAAGQKGAMKSQLRAAVDTLFEAREQNHHHRLERMRGMLAKMESHLKEREAKRASIVDKHVEDLTTGPGDRW